MGSEFINQAAWYTVDESVPLNAGSDWRRLK